MSKQLVFLEETKLNFYSKPVSFNLTDNEYFILSDANTIIYKTANSEKSTLSISKFISFDKREKSVVLERLSKSEFLLITTKMRVFKFEIDFPTQILSNLTVIAFQYGKSLKNGSVNVVFKNESHVFLQVTKLIFDFVIKENQFKLFKILNEPIVDLKFEDEFLYVLTTKHLTKFVFRSQNQIHIPRQIYKFAIEDVSQIEIFDEQIYMLNANSQITIFNQAKQTILRSFAIKKSSGTKIPISKMIKTENKTLLFYNDQFLYVFLKECNSIVNVFRINDYDFIVNKTHVFALSRKTENIFKTINVQEIKYNKLNKHDLFYKQTTEAQLSILLAYLTKQYFKRIEMNNHLELLRELLAPLFLRKSVLQNPKLKDFIVKFFTIVKDFATIRLRTSIDKFLVDKPVIDCWPCGDTSPENGKNQVGFNETETCATTADSTCSFSVCEDRLIVKSTTMKFESLNFNDREKRIIANNLKKRVGFNQNNLENEEIEFIRAQNRIIRLNAGRKMLLTIISKTGFDLKEKIWFCFFVFDKFKMRRSILILLKIVMQFDISVSLSKISKSLNQIKKRKLTNF